MIPTPGLAADALTDRLADRLRPSGRLAPHTLEAVAEAAARVVREGGPLWADPLLQEFALARALWAVGEEAAAAELLATGPAEILEASLRRRLCAGTSFSAFAVCLVQAGLLRVEAWPSAPEREVVRIRLDPAAARDCLRSELVMRQTLIPLLEAAAVLAGETGVLALELPGAARPQRDRFLAASHDWRRARRPATELWCLA
jgi:hypothetical protein